MVEWLFRKIGWRRQIVPSAKKGIVYTMSDSPQRVILAPEVIKVFREHKQRSHDAPEVGGQLFARFIDGDVLIKYATGPLDGDRHDRYNFTPCRKQENRDIRRLFRNHLHFVGDWHTHPQTVPKPSQTDIESIAECFRLSRHELLGFVLIVVGLSEFPDGLHVTVNNVQRTQRLIPLPGNQL